MNETVIPAEDLDVDVSETLVVREWRAEQLRRLGVPSILAETFADDVTCVAIKIADT